MKTLNCSIKHHTVIGVLIWIWGFVFAFFSRPFEHGDMDLQKWILVSIGFSMFAFISYLIVSYIQKLIYHKTGHWNLFYEVGVYGLFFTLYALFTYFYYRSPLVNGYYDFLQFLRNIIFNLILITTPIIFFLRMYAHKLIENKEALLVIKGENQLDILKLKSSDLVCISNAQNYVEIFYLEEHDLKSKLMRSTLKNMQKEYPFLMQVHRSHLINPAHFKSWKDSSTISLTKLELPVSKTYKQQLLKL